VYGQVLLTSMIYLIVRLQAAAMAKLQAVKADTATGLLYAIEQQKFTKITINVKPTFIILPEQGVYRP